MWVQVAQTMEGRDAPANSPPVHFRSPVYIFQGFFLERVGILGDFQLVSHLQIDFSSIFPVKYF